MITNSDMEKPVPIDLGDGSLPTAVAIKSDGTQVYFTCNSEIQNDDKVKYADTVTFIIDEVRDQSGAPAVIPDPIDIAIEEIYGPGVDYYTALLHSVRAIPDTTFASPIGQSRSLLIAAIQTIIDHYDLSDAETITRTIADVQSARNTAIQKLSDQLFEASVIARLDHGLDILTWYLEHTEAGGYDPQTWTKALETTINGIPAESFSDPNSQQLALNKAQQATTQLEVAHYDQALQRLNELKAIIQAQLNDIAMYHRVMDLIARAQDLIEDIISSFTQAGDQAETMAGTVSGLPNSAFRNNGARNSLLNHIGQLEDRCDDRRLDQALQKTSQVRSDILSKITDPAAQTQLLAVIDQIIDLLNTIPR